MRRLQLSKYLTILLVLLQTMLFSHENCHFQLYGYVIDDHDDEPLPFANLFLMETQQGASTDSTGYFKISNICPATYTLRLSHIGCESREVKVQVFSDLNQNFVLEKDSF